MREELLLKSVFGGLLLEFLFLLIEAFLGAHGLAILRLLESAGIDKGLTEFEVKSLGVGRDAPLALVDGESHSEQSLGVCCSQVIALTSEGPDWSVVETFFHVLHVIAVDDVEGKNQSNSAYALVPGLI